MRVFKKILLVVLILLLLAMGLLLWRMLTTGENLETILSAPTPAPPVLEAMQPPAAPQGDRVQDLLDRAYAQAWNCVQTGEAISDGTTARIPIRLTVLNGDALAGTGIWEELRQEIEARVEQARFRAEIFDDDNAYRQDLLQEIYRTHLEERLLQVQNYWGSWDTELRYTYDGETWQLQNEDALTPFRPDAEALFESATKHLPLYPLRYTLPEDALQGNVPREDCFLETEDPWEVAALLERPEARMLIGNQDLVWNPELPFVSGTKIRCYLDESILCILWQEPEHDCLGTFSEIFISDGSQLRRKISSDEPWSYWFERTSEFARDTNAVLAQSGDFYFHDRNCGVAVYQRQLIRFRPDNADTCFITADGDMLFLYRGDGISEEEMQQYLVDNDVVFSLAFGPVLIDNGVEVTPDYYPWGEIDLYYARSALGLLGRHHYLTMTINCDTTRPELDHLPDLEDASYAMVRRGCWKAYTLDGGQTASTAFHGQLINPVQFGKEKPISDIIYFASAMPEE